MVVCVSGLVCVGMSHVVSCEVMVVAVYISVGGEREEGEGEFDCGVECA